MTPCANARDEPSLHERGVYLKLLPDLYITNGPLVCRRFHTGDYTRMGVGGNHGPMSIAPGPTWTIATKDRVLAVAGLVAMPDGLQLWSQVQVMNLRQWVFARRCTSQILASLSPENLYAIADPGCAYSVNFLRGLGFNIEAAWEAEGDDMIYRQMKRAA